MLYTQGNWEREGRYIGGKWAEQAGRKSGRVQSVRECDRADKVWEERK